MTNGEFYLDEIVRIAVYDDNKLAVSLKDGKPVACHSIECSDCTFSYGNTCNYCSLNRQIWLKAEHVEQPKLTKAERAFCESLKCTQFYVARDENGGLYVYELKPTKQSYDWSITNNCYYWTINRGLFNVPFDFIKWSDSEPWKVEDLLKLEVIDDE